MSPLAEAITPHIVPSLIPPVFHWPLKFCGGVTAACYVLSVITGNLSQVDRIWTFAPTIYTAYFALLPFWSKQPSGFFYPYTPDSVHKYVTATYSSRALLMLGLQTLWMSRLSYNTYRRGLFNLHDEDYRWEILRRKLPRWLLEVTNFFFIAIIQNILLFLLGVPASIAATQPHEPLSTSDYVLAGASVLTLLFEFTADNQQYAFQTFKHGGARDPRVEWPGARLSFSPEDRNRGFITRGLWAWSRHPNFLAEQTFWILQTLIPLVSPQPPSLPLLPDALTPLWPLTPALALCALFLASTAFTESITRGKYPESYAAYQERVAMFVPLLTPLWGALAAVRGRKDALDRAVYGTQIGDTAEGKKDL